MKRNLIIALALSVGFAACSSSEESTKSTLSPAAKQQEKALSELSQEVADLKKQVESADDGEVEDLQRRIEELEEKLRRKLRANSLVNANNRKLKVADAVKGHTRLFKFEGEYKVLVIPVQFQDVKMARPAFFQKDAQGNVPAQQYLFGTQDSSLRTYYKHSSGGKLDVMGKVVEPVTVQGNLEDYGEAIPGRSDKAARELVVQALQGLKQRHTEDSWWEQYDNWDLNDYDRDGNYHEPDGFMDAVILVYAGKSQASCQRSFDPDGKRPPTATVPDGPRKVATVECFNRIWPHRWGISLSSSDPRYSAKGPLVEGIQRSSMNGYKITDSLFAVDYNMQAEFSDLSTFIHEFGHSLTLPDVYARGGTDNSTGAWEIMSRNARLQAQEFSTFSKVSLGWSSPKLVPVKKATSFYLGAGNFLPVQEREAGNHGFEKTTKETLNGFDHDFDIVSKVPGFGEAVYRSAIAFMPPSREIVQVVKTPTQTETVTAYTGRFNAGSKSYKLKVDVPASGSAELSFDTIYFIETETNFSSTQPNIKVVTDYDVGQVLVDGKELELLRLVSGDQNYDTLAELNPKCEAARVLALRKKNVDGTITDAEKTEFSTKTKVCQEPVWVNKKYDLSAYRGQKVEFEIRYTTDAGYTEFGIVFDNIKLGNTTVDFESGESTGDFTSLVEGAFELTHNQFYIFEHRDPTAKYTSRLSPTGPEYEASLNFDQNIRIGNQSFFLETPGSLTDRFRMVEIDYQPGVLVWYFNSKYNRIQNSSALQNGKGYLLVVNSKTQELKLPGPLGASNLFDANGHYETAGQTYKDAFKKQRDAFVCFSHTAYASYITGVQPDCSAYPQTDEMKKLTFNGKKLVFRREGFNQFLPQDQYDLYGVGRPFRNSAGIRTALSTFNPAGSGDRAPFKIYRVNSAGQLVLDNTMTKNAGKYASVSEFKDTDAVFPAEKRFQGDSVNVEKVGFSFKVHQPSKRITDLYSEEIQVLRNNHKYRRPLAKIELNWE